MGRPRKIQPADGGAITDPVTEPVRDQIKQMTGFQNEGEMENALPDNTTSAAPVDDKPRRKRRTKAEIEAERGGGGTVSETVDPLLSDPKYKRALENMTSDAGTGFVRGGFDVAAVATGDKGWKLAEDEEKKSDDFFYVLSRKYGWFDPTKSPITMAVYFFAMLGSFVATRMLKNKGEDMISYVSGLFGFGDKATAENEKENATTTA